MSNTAKEVTDEMTKDEFKELVENIEQVAALGKKIQSSRLTERAIILFIQDSIPTHITKSAIRSVLHALPLLEQQYLKPKKKNKR